MSFAPIIHFDTVSAFSQRHGIVSVSLSVNIVSEIKDNKAINENFMIAHLRTSLVGAQLLRDTLDKALLLSMPTGESIS